MNLNQSTRAVRTKLQQSLFMILTLSALSVFAQDQAGGQIEKARKAYNLKQYEAAISEYRAVLDQGLESSELYYNLGNAFYRTRDYTSAIYYYEKALKLQPNDPDTKHNLQVANSKITDKIDEVPEIFYVTWWEAFLNLYSLNLFAALVITSLAAALALAGLYFVSHGSLLRTALSWSSFVFLFAFVLFFVASAEKKHKLDIEHEAIVTGPTVSVKSSPDDSSADLFVIHEGTKVELLDKIGPWQEIRIRNGSEGWMKEKDIRKL